MIFPFTYRYYPRRMNFAKSHCSQRYSSPGLQYELQTSILGYVGPGIKRVTQRTVFFLSNE